MHINHNRWFLNMRVANGVFWLAYLSLCQAMPVQAACNTSPDLAANVIEFRTRQTSRVEALIRLGERLNLCFGIEYVDPALLTEPVDFQLQNRTVQSTVESIFGPEYPIRMEQHYGVIEITRKPRAAKGKNIFDFVIPKWESERGMVQLVSWLLHIQLVTELNPRIKGFGGHGRAGDVEDEVGPFKEHNQPVRYLLDKIVAQSKGAVWIAQIPWQQIENFRLLDDRRAWTIVEYGGASADYRGLLKGIAAELESGSDSRHSVAIGPRSPR